MHLAAAHRIILKVYQKAGAIFIHLDPRIERPATLFPPAIDVDQAEPTEGVVGRNRVVRCICRWGRTSRQGMLLYWPRFLHLCKTAPPLSSPRAQFDIGSGGGRLTRNRTRAVLDSAAPRIRWFTGYTQPQCIVTALFFFF